MRNEEYQIYKQIATYMRYQYPKVAYRFDQAGLNLSKAQAGMNKAIQDSRGWPDLFIAEPKKSLSIVDFDLEEATAMGEEHLNYMLAAHPPKEIRPHYSGLFIEVKKDGTVLRRPKDARMILKGETKLRLAGDWFDDHIEEQAMMLERLRKIGYMAEFSVGFMETKHIIDTYLKT